MNETAGRNVKNSEKGQPVELDNAVKQLFDKTQQDWIDYMHQNALRYATTPKGLPSYAEDRFRCEGIPVRFFHYQASSELTLGVSAAGEEFVAFGDVADGSRICLVFATGHVVELAAREFGGESAFVNTSLELFCLVVETLRTHLPFGIDENTPLATRSAIANTVRGLVAAVDAPATEMNTFWATFVDDLEMGSVRDHEC